MAYGEVCRGTKGASRIVQRPPGARRSFAIGGAWLPKPNAPVEATLRTLRSVSLSAALAAFALAAAACTSDNNSGTPSQPTLDAAFLGYSNPANQQTTCGNCHTNLQVSWVKTGHARAWADLQASGHASAACYGCHTVSGLTNSAPDSTGYFAVDSTAKKYYEDVQCESCHGPGATHVQAPDETQPIPSISAGVGATTGCATCHNGTHHPFVEDWSESAHSTVLAPPTSNSSSSCRGCHTGQGALARFDTKANYAEINSTRSTSRVATTRWSRSWAPSPSAPRR